MIYYSVGKFIGYLIRDIAHHVDVACCCARLSIQRQLEYPLFLVSFMLMIPIQYATGLLVLKVLVDKFQALGGWSFPELTFLYGLGIISHAFVVIFFIPTWGIDEAIIRGNFDRFLLRPLNVFFHFCSYQFNFIGVIDLVPALMIFIVGCAMLEVQISFMFCTQVVLIIVGATLIRVAIYLVVGTVAFWTKRSRPLTMMALSVMDRTTQFPISIYPYLLQVLLTYCIPIAFINFIPASHLLDKSSNMILPMGAVLWTPSIGGVCFWGAHGFFRYALSRYESTGS